LVEAKKRIVYRDERRSGPRHSSKASERDGLTFKADQKAAQVPRVNGARDETLRDRRCEIAAQVLDQPPCVLRDSLRFTASSGYQSSESLLDYRLRARVI
jgi:hypothetical protein